MYFNRRTLKVITPPVSGGSGSTLVTKVVSVTELKTFARISGTSEDTLISEFIDIATEALAQWTRRSILKQTLELSLDSFGGQTDDNLTGKIEGIKGFSVNEIDLPLPPALSITSIKTYDETNTEATMDSTTYELDEIGGRIYLDSGVSWPSALRAREAVKIRYIAGYGASATGVPVALKQAIRQYAAKLYECRTVCDIPPECKALAQPYRLLDVVGF